MRLRSASAFLVGSLLIFAGPAASDDTAEILAAVRARAAEHESALGSMLLTEVATQTKADGANFAKRQTTGDLALVHVSGRLLAFRDVQEVNGTPVHDKDDRLSRALLGGKGTEADALNLQSARHHFMSLGRNFNTPTLALTLLAAPKDGVKISRVKPDSINQQKGLRLEFTEEGSPTLARTWEGRDAAARGTVFYVPGTREFIESRLTWVAQQTSSSGDPVRTELTVTVNYAPDERLGVSVPVEMREIYVHEADRVECVTTYKDTRRIAP